jgi:hypothetical protein
MVGKTQRQAGAVLDYMHAHTRAETKDQLVGAVGRTFESNRYEKQTLLLLFYHARHVLLGIVDGLPRQAQETHTNEQTAGRNDTQEWSFWCTKNRAQLVQTLQKDAQAVRKTPLFSQLFLCLSRACLGKMIVYIHELLKKGVFRRWLWLTVQMRKQHIDHT